MVCGMEYRSMVKVGFPIIAFIRNLAHVEGQQKKKTNFIRNLTPQMTRTLCLCFDKVLWLATFVFTVCYTENRIIRGYIKTAALWNLTKN